MKGLLLPKSSSVSKSKEPEALTIQQALETKVIPQLKKCQLGFYIQNDCERLNEVIHFCHIISQMPMWQVFQLQPPHDGGKKGPLSPITKAFLEEDRRAVQAKYVTKDEQQQKHDSHAGKDKRKTLTSQQSAQFNWKKLQDNHQHKSMNNAKKSKSVIEKYHSMLSQTIIKLNATNQVQPISEFYDEVCLYV